MELGRVRGSKISDSLPALHFTEISKSVYSLSMRTLFIIPLVLMSLVSLPSWGLSMDDLVQREGLYYQKFTDVPFTGEVDEGREHLSTSCHALTDILHSLTTQQWHQRSSLSLDARRWFDRGVVDSRSSDCL